MRIVHFLLVVSCFAILPVYCQLPVKYMPLGDSYTIGEGLPAEERFPNQLIEMLSPSVDVTLGSNPAQTGWTTQDLIDKELPLFRSEKPGFATLLIGVNDWVQKVDEATFRKNFIYIVKEMIRVLGDKDRLLVVTIPDFSATPEGKKYGHGRDITAGIAGFNAIIAEECGKRKIHVTDIFPTTQKMKDNPALIAPDGLHPSAKEYKLWAELILPQSLKVLKKYAHR